MEDGAADSFDGRIEIENAGSVDASVQIPEETDIDATIHIICEVTDNGTPQLTGASQQPESENGFGIRLCRLQK